MERRGAPHDRKRVSDVAARRNTEIIVEEPKVILDLIKTERRFCGRRVITQTLLRYVGDDRRLLRRTHKAVMAAHAESQAKGIFAALSALAGRRRQLLSIGDDEELRVLDRRVTEFTQTVGQAMRREPALVAALSRLPASSIRGAFHDLPTDAVPPGDPDHAFRM